MSAPHRHIVAQPAAQRATFELQTWRSPHLCSQVTLYIFSRALLPSTRQIRPPVRFNTFPRDNEQLTSLDLATQPSFNTFEYILGIYQNVNTSMSKQMTGIKLSISEYVAKESMRSFISKELEKILTLYLLLYFFMKCIKFLL